MTDAKYSELFESVRESVKDNGKPATMRAISCAHMGSPSRAVDCNLSIAALRIYRNHVSSDPAQLIAVALDS
jgi:hypothetical protein